MFKFQNLNIVSGLSFVFFMGSSRKYDQYGTWNVQAGSFIVCEVRELWSLPFIYTTDNPDRISSN